MSHLKSCIGKGESDYIIQSKYGDFIGEKRNKQL